MKRILLFAAFLALPGCGTLQVQRVDVPVPVPCVDRSKIPAEPVSKFAATEKTAPVDDQVRALLIDHETGRIYGKRVRALVEACVITDATSSADRAPSPVKP